FDMAHALTEHEGECRNIHGHTYHLSVTVIGRPLQSPRDSDDGMVMDFSELKKIVMQEIIRPLDHAIVLSETDLRSEQLRNETKLVITKYRPTCENLLTDLVLRLQKHFYGSVKLHSVTLRETPTSYATWSASY